MRARQKAVSPGGPPGTGEGPGLALSGWEAYIPQKLHSEPHRPVENEVIQPSTGLGGFLTMCVETKGCEPHR